MHFDAFERPIDQRTLELRRKGCYELARQWFRLRRAVQRWDRLSSGLGLLGGIGRGFVSGRAAAVENSRQEVWGELLKRFSSVLLDACVIARPESSYAELESDMIKIVITCDRSRTVQNGCLPEILWMAASDQYNLDGIAHIDLRRKFHLRALLDEVEAGDDRAAVRFFAFGTPEEREAQKAPGGALKQLYPVHKESLSAGYTRFAKRLHELRPDLERMTRGAITATDARTIEDALRLIGTCLGVR